MSPLLDPGLGDLLDRLTILLLKIKYGQRLKRPVEHFEVEYKAVRDRIGTFNGHYREESRDRLLELNEGIWLATDQFRQATTNAQKAALGMKMVDLNDRRASLIRVLNQAGGDTRPPEKVS